MTKLWQFFKAGRKVLEVTDPDDVDDYLFCYVSQNPLKTPVLRCTTGCSALMDVALAIMRYR